MGNDEAARPGLTESALQADTDEPRFRKFDLDYLIFPSP